MATPFPLVTAVIEQTIAYAAYFRDSRDIRVVIWALLFVAVCLAPAIIIDAILLPAKLVDASGSGRSNFRQIR